ncbi:MAG: hypothetical protein J6X55_16665 [Victivallales bacterium]|nr:hypothetical protein [Victivallales bacterium]
MTRMKMFFSLVLVLVLATGSSLMAQKSSKSFVVQKGGKKIEGRISAAPNGRVTISTQSGNLSLNPGQYEYVVTPKPDEVEELEDLLDDESYNKLAEKAPAVFEKYKYLGWADTVARLQCEGLLALNRKADAEKILAAAKKLPRADEFNLTSAELQLLVHDKKLEDVEKKLNAMMGAEDDAVMAFVFNMRGRVNEMQGNKKEAVLQYLKTFLVFEDKKKFRRFRKEAKANALRLMKELKDPTAQILEGLK